MTLLFTLAKPLLHRMDPENAHNLTIDLLKRFGPRKPVEDDPRLAVSLFGLNFSNPLGLAAGFDKNAEVPDAMLGLGFGFVECGTVTPRPQAGNPKPRLFRLREDRAVINRMGFNNGGMALAAANLARRKGGGIVGINIGANKDSTDRAADYVTCAVALAPSNRSPLWQMRNRRPGKKGAPRRASGVRTSILTLNPIASVRRWRQCSKRRRSMAAPVLPRSGRGWRQCST